MTVIDVCNRALAALGHDRTITSLTDGTTEAARCNVFYPVARDKVLSDFAWEWATKTASLTANTSYSLPAAAVRIIDARASDGNPVNLVRTGNTVKSKVAATLRYVANDVSFDSFPSYVVDAIASQLAALLFAPMLGNPSGDECKSQEQFYAIANSDLERAKALDIQEHSFMGAPETPSAVARTDIANRALAIIGSSRLIRDISEDPCEEAVRCRQLLPMAIRKVLAAHTWEFACKTVTAASSPWTIPSDFVRLVWVRSDTGTIGAFFGSGALVFNGTNARVKYVTDSIGVDKFPASAVETVVYALAASMAASMGAGDDKGNGGGDTAVTLAKQYEIALQGAMREDDESTAWRAEPENEKDLAKTDICNRALSLIGSTRMIKDFNSDPSIVATRCRQLYKAALDDVVADHDWDFATDETQLATLHPGPDGFTRVAVPEDMVRLVGVFDSMGHKIQAERRNGNLHIRSTVADGACVSIRYVSSDMNLFDAPVKCREAVVYKLAALLANAFGDKDGARRADVMEVKAKAKMSEAETVDAAETASPGPWENPFLAARR